MKKFIIVMLVAMTAVTGLFASRGFVNVTLGAVAQSSYDIDDIKTGEIKNLSLENFAFGAELETKVTLLDFDVKALYDSANKGISGQIGAGVAFDIVMVRAKAGLGYEVGYNFDTKEMHIGNGNGYCTDVADFKNACMNINAGADVLLGDFSIGAFATLPTNVSIAEGNWKDLLTCLKDNWSQAKLGVMIGYSIL